MSIRSIVLPAALLALSLAAAPARQDDKPSGSVAACALREGSWSYAAPRNILGKGSATTIKFSKLSATTEAIGSVAPSEEWVVTYTHIFYHSVNENKEPTVSTSGPFRVEVDAEKHILSIYDGAARPSQATFAFSPDGARFTMPAFVETEPGHFLFVSRGERCEVHCADDPRKIPVGVCVFPDTYSGRGFYSYEEAPRELDRSEDFSERYLRLMQRVEGGGHLIERGRLIWDDWGAPRHERLTSTGIRRSSRYRLNVWHAAK